MHKPINLLCAALLAVAAPILAENAPAPDEYAEFVARAVGDLEPEEKWERVDGLWAEALTDPGLKWLDMLWKRDREFRAALADRRQGTKLMMEAIEDERIDAVNWLLEHGVPANIPGEDEETRGDGLLSEALRHDDSGEIAVLLMSRGAKPAGLNMEFINFATIKLVAGEKVLLVASRRLGYIPKDFLEVGVDDHPPLLPLFVESRLPVEEAGFNWLNGVEPIDAWADKFQDAAYREMVRRDLPVLTRRMTHLAPEVYNLARYKAADDRTWEVRASGLPRAQSEEFGHFATALCAFFLPAECGPRERLDAARNWFDSLPDCAAANLTKFGEPACRLYESVRRLKENTISWYAWEGEDQAARKPLKSWGDLIQHYPVREWPRAQ